MVAVHLGQQCEALRLHAFAGRLQVQLHALAQEHPPGDRHPGASVLRRALPGPPPVIIVKPSFAISDFFISLKE